MADETILMKKLDELVLNGYGDALMYGCEIAVNAALEGYRKGERKTAFTGELLGAVITLGIIKATSIIKKYCEQR